MGVAVQEGLTREKQAAAPRLLAHELPVEFGLGEHQGGGAAVWTMMSVGRQVTLLEQRVDLLWRERIARLDRRFARHHVQQFVDEIAGGDWPA